jgi:hypothetical protein
MSRGHSGVDLVRRIRQLRAYTCSFALLVNASLR